MQGSGQVSSAASSVGLACGQVQEGWVEGMVSRPQAVGIVVSGHLATDE